MTKTPRNTLWDRYPRLSSFLFVIYGAIFAYCGIRYMMKGSFHFGRDNWDGGIISRDQDPVEFWTVITLFASAGTFFFIYGLIRLARPQGRK